MGSDDVEREIGRLGGRIEALQESVDGLRIAVESMRTNCLSCQIKAADERGQSRGSRRVLVVVGAVAAVAGAGGAKAIDVIFMLLKATS